MKLFKDAMEKCREVMRKYPKWFNDHYFVWTSVRGLGELQFLTRASYLVLFIVPVMASVWTPVAKGLNYSMEKYDRVLRQHPYSHDSAGDSSLQEARTSETASPKTGRYSEDLPREWRLSFVAAVLVATGNLIYQLRCPLEIKKFDTYQWESVNREKFQISDSETLMLHYLGFYNEAAYGGLVDSKTVFQGNYYHLLDLDSDHLALSFEKLTNRFKITFNNHTMLEDPVLREAARLGYENKFLLMNAENPLAIVSCGACYIGGCGILSYLLFQQVWNVLS